MRALASCMLLPVALSTAAPVLATETCASLLPASEAATPARRLQPEDLVRLRDIGPVDPDPHAEPFFTISPDGRHAAFQLRQADPDRNGYCLGVAVLALDGTARPRLVDRGGALLLLDIDLRGRAQVPTGIPLVVTPRWSPDGRWIAFLKRQGDSTQIWRAMADGSSSHALTSEADDVVDFRIAADGRSIIYVTRRAERQQIEAEALRGYHYDDRFSPVASNRPFPLAPVARRVQVLELATGATRPAEPEEAASVGGGTPAVHNSFGSVWIRATGLTGGAQAGALRARRKDGSEAVCRPSACTGATDPWLLSDGRRIRFLRREGWARASTAIYEWSLATGRVRRLYLTDDMLADCAPDGASLLCLREGSLQPRRLERLEPRSGRRTVLFDPNPGFEKLHLGAARRLHWRNAFGLEVAADLVLPVGYRPGVRVPLVVVQYDTRGFLRGGTGDEYPIQAFASRGYAVLSVRRPEAIALARGARDFKEGNRINLEGFADRRSALSAVETGVKLVIDQGVADPHRIGITGLSNGATTTISALLHSRLFTAAAISSCCMDTTLPARVGPSAARDFYATGYPKMTDRNETFWKQISLSLNARDIRTPLLLQLAQDEYLSALESYTALREVCAPVDMFIFEGEHHVKWQPAHRLAVYTRALDWFDYWLRGIRLPDPEREPEIRHWETLKAQSGRLSASCPS